MRTPDGLLTLNGNVLAAVDVETTGRLSGFHEIIQIAVVPLTAELEPCKDIRPFYMNIAPSFPERAERNATNIHGLNLPQLQAECPDCWKVADLFDEWVQRLELPFRRQIVPLAHNWAFERGFLSHWLGLESFNQFFHPHPRDSMLLAISINDAAAFHGLPIPFSYVGLGSMCKRFGIEVGQAHDALHDALAEAKLYKALLTSFGR